VNPAIEVQSVSKRFRLYKEKYTSLKERILHAGKVPFEEFWALRDIELDIYPGETIGILGRNGSGKSTLLKCIAGILTPTSGQIVVRGQLAAMLELGAGFQPEMSGRDNIYLNASLLGLSRRQIERSFDDIVAFAELEDFIDNQVRFYSSGMYVRLGFAVAVNVDPDVLLVDEVLAVGDERFQQKCMERIHQFQQEGRTIVVVSHAADVMRQICKRVAVIDAGRVISVAPPGEAIRAFRDRLLATGVPDEALPAIEDTGGIPVTTTGPISGPRRVEMRVTSVDRPHADERPHMLTGERLAVTFEVTCRETVPETAIGVSIFGSDGGLVFDCDSDTLDDVHELPAGTSTVVVEFPSIPFLDGRFDVNARVQERGGGKVHARVEPAVTIEVVNPGHATGFLSLPFNVKVSSGRDDGGPV